MSYKGMNVRVAVYGRVSTQHDAQLSALDNQKEWYEDLAIRYPEWNIVKRYFDEGITGTATKKRANFMKMIEDAQNGEFELIITREISRFARNTQDALDFCHRLRDVNVEVYFINDNIWSLNRDDDFRLTVMAGVAQEESRKTSERTKAGQHISRQKHVLYGNGNILGYTRVGKTYQIDEEQAETVRRIFDLYSTGEYGFKKICNILTAEGRKNSSGAVKWTVDAPARIVRNRTYAGKICYNKSESRDYLSHKRIYKNEDLYEYVDGEFDPIITDELWLKCKKIREERSHAVAETSNKKRGKYPTNSVWVEKMRCSCGSSFQKYKWRTNADGTPCFGYGCYRKARSPSAGKLKMMGGDISGLCQQNTFAEWKLDLMAKKIFTLILNEKKEAVLLACKLIEECYTNDVNSYESAIESSEQRIKKLEIRKSKLRAMCADELISRKEFEEDYLKIGEEILSIQNSIEGWKEEAKKQKSKSGVSVKKIKEVLDAWTDFSANKVFPGMIEQFVLQIIVENSTTFNWTINVLGDKDSMELRASSIAFSKYQARRTGHNIDTEFESKIAEHLFNPVEVFRFELTKADAQDYCKLTGLRFFASKWKDITVIVSI